MGGLAWAFGRDAVCVWIVFAFYDLLVQGERRERDQHAYHVALVYRLVFRKEVFASHAVYDFSINVPNSVTVAVNPNVNIKVSLATRKSQPYISPRRRTGRCARHDTAENARFIVVCPFACAHVCAGRMPRFVGAHCASILRKHDRGG